MSNEELQLNYITKEWKPIPRIARTIPFGYTEDPNDPEILIPVVFELEALEKAKIHLKQFPLREVAHWLTQTTGRYISHMGLKKRIKCEQSRKRKINALEQYAKRLEETREKIQAIEARIGAGEALTNK